MPTLGYGKKSRKADGFDIYELLKEAHKPEEVLRRNNSECSIKEMNFFRGEKDGRISPKGDLQASMVKGISKNKARNDTS